MWGKFVFDWFFWDFPCTQAWSEDRWKIVRMNIKNTTNFPQNIKFFLRKLSAFFPFSILKIYKKKIKFKSRCFKKVYCLQRRQKDRNNFDSNLPRLFIPPNEPLGISNLFISFSDSISTEWVSFPPILLLCVNIGGKISDEKAFINHVYSTSLPFFVYWVQLEKWKKKNFFPGNFFVIASFFSPFYRRWILMLSLEGLK